MDEPGDLRRRNRTVAIAAAGMVVVMGGLVALSPVFYGALTEFLGYGGAVRTGKTTRSLKAAGVGKDISVRFATNVAADLDVVFRPDRRSVNAEIGRPQTLYFDLVNKAAAPVVLRTAFDVTPAWAAPYFFKSVDSLHTIERISPGAHVRVPVVFYVDRRILDDTLAAGVGAVTLSYTLLRQPGMADGAPAGIGDLGERARAMTARLQRGASATFANKAASE